MGSKYFDLVIALFMGYFAYTRYATEQYGFAILFTVLCALNLFTGFMKHKRLKAETEEK